MIVEISKENEGTETRLERWLHVSSEMENILFLPGAWILADTRRSYDVPGQGSSVQFLHITKNKR